MPLQKKLKYLPEKNEFHKSGIFDIIMLEIKSMVCGSIEIDFNTKKISGYKKNIKKYNASKTFAVSQITLFFPTLKSIPHFFPQFVFGQVLTFFQVLLHTQMILVVPHFD